MEIEYLKTVLLVAKNKSFSKTAELIPCAQSSVSRQINSVETEIGARIFIRTKGGKVELTECGERLIPIINDIVENHGKLLDAVSQSQDTENCSIRLLLYSGPFPASYQTKLMNSAYTECSNILLSVSVSSKTRMAEALLNNQADVCVGYSPYLTETGEPFMESFPADVQLYPLFDIYPKIAMPKDHPLASRRSVSMEDLKYESFIITSQRPANPDNWNGQHEAFYQSCIKAGFVPKLKVINKQTLADTRDAAVITNGWMYPTFMTKSAQPAFHDIAYIPMEDPIYFARYWLMVPKYRKVAGLEEFTSFIKKHLTKGDNSCKLL